MSARQDRPLDSFASASVVALVIRALREIDSELLPAHAKEPDHLAGARVRADVKTSIVDHAYEKGGVLPLLSVGQTLGDVPFLPAGRVVLRSANTDVLAEKWMRLEKYHHSTHRVEIDHDRDRQWICTRKWTTAAPPTDGENILVCGIMAGLLDLYGCQDVSGSIGGFEIRRPDRAASPVWIAGDTRRWELNWKEVHHSQSGTGRTDRNGTSASAEDGSPVDHLTSLLGEDVGRVWKLEDAARELGRSPRSLQRDIKAAGHTFSSLVRGTRVREACRLLLEPDPSLSDIGYSCGYADQPHFQRDFRRVANMTPGEYRAAGRADSALGA